MRFFSFGTGGDSKKVLLDDVNYIKNRGRKVCINTDNGILEIYGEVNSIFPKLDSRFCKSHGSLIVNLEKIDRFYNGNIKFFNGDDVYIGSHNLRLTKNRYRVHLEASVKTQ